LPVSGRRWRGPLGLLALLVCVLPASASAYSTAFELRTGSTFADSSGVALSTTASTYPSGASFDVEVDLGSGPPGVALLTFSGVTFPSVTLAFSERYTFRLETAGGQLTDSFEATAFLSSGRIETTAPLRIRMSRFQGSQKLGDEILSIPLTTETVSFPPCDSGSGGSISGLRFGSGAPGELTLVHGRCITEFAGVQGYDTPLVIRLAGSLEVECSDGLDNDSDGMVDHPSDFGCLSPLDPTEGGDCGNGQIDAGEQCDDGNEVGGDCCTALCQYEPAFSPCSDTNVCTDGDSCNGVGTCVPGPVLDCDDGLFCNGAEACNLLVGCVGGTPPPVDDGIACTADSCDEVQDLVVHVPDDGFCDNGLFCDGSEVCDPGSGCVVGNVPGLDDGISCTQDECVEASGQVTHTPLDSLCNDGLFCNGEETCDAVLDCQAGTPPVVDDGVSCTADDCDEASDSIVHTPNDAACDNGLFCDGSETCDAVLDCQPGSAPQLDDGVGCTVDSCDEGADIVRNDASDALCDNGLFCDGAETCDPALDCQAGALLILDDGVACTVDSCDEAADTVTHVGSNALCDDGSFCNGAETCDLFTDCQPGVPPNPDDGLACTIDGCSDELGSLTHIPNDALCNNGLFCDGSETCRAGIGCVAGVPPGVDDGIGCTIDSCDEQGDQILNVPDDGACDDGSACTVDSCSAATGCEADPIDQCFESLLIEEVVGPDEVSVGAQVRLDAAVSNPGSASPPLGNVDVVFFLSADEIIEIPGDVFVGQCAVPGIAPGATEGCSQQVEVPSRIGGARLVGSQDLWWGACAQSAGLPGDCRVGPPVSVVPEPARLAAALSAVIALAGLARVRRRVSPAGSRIPIEERSPGSPDST